MEDEAICQDDVEDEPEFAFGGAVSKIAKAVSKPFRNLKKTASAPAWDEADEYDFAHPHRGIMLLFNNEFFKNHSSRPGTAVDAEKVEQTFGKLGFTVHRHDNKTRDEMLRILKKAAKADHSTSDCFACVVLSHGDEVHLIDKGQPEVREREDVVYATDQIILTKEIVRMFVDDKCASLQGKPRLFFVQACRGGNLDDGAIIAVRGRDEFDAKSIKGIEVQPCPIYKDFLIAYATPPGFYAFRRADTGSWFINGLCSIMSKPNIENLSLTKLLTMVHQLVGQQFESYSKEKKEISGKKQTPCFCSMLVKDVYFKSRPHDQS